MVYRRQFQEAFDVRFIHLRRILHGLRQGLLLGRGAGAHLRHGIDQDLLLLGCERLR